MSGGIFGRGNLGMPAAKEVSGLDQAKKKTENRPVRLIITLKPECDFTCVYVGPDTTNCA